jgi:hypothetical protein
LNRSAYIINTKFSNDIAFVAGDDIFISKGGPVVMQIETTNYYKIAVYSTFAHFYMYDSKFDTCLSLGPNGGAIQSFNDFMVSITNTQFLNSRAQKGGAIYIEQQSFSKGTAVVPIIRLVT